MEGSILKNMNAMKRMLKDNHGRLLEYWILAAVICISLAVAFGQRSLWKGILTFFIIIAGIAALIGLTMFFGRLGYRGKLKRLRKKLESPDPEVRRAASEALGELWYQGREAIADLTGALKDPDEGVRFQAAISLSNFREDGKTAAVELIKWVRSADHDIRREAVDALEKIGSGAREALPVLFDALSDRDWPDRWHAAAAICFIGPGPDDAGALIRVLEEDTARYAAEWAVKALGRTTPAAVDSIPALVKAIAEKGRDIRGAAIDVLGNMGARAAPAVPEITAALRDEDNWIRGSAASALGEIGPAAKDAVPALRAMTQDPDEWVCEMVRKALVKIQG